jgi:hypothetical protein
MSVTVDRPTRILRKLLYKLKVLALAAMSFLAFEKPKTQRSTFHVPRQSPWLWNQDGISRVSVPSFKFEIPTCQRVLDWQFLRDSIIIIQV